MKVRSHTRYIVFSHISNSGSGKRQLAVSGNALDHTAITYNSINIVNSLEYFYWKKYSLFCHIAELSTPYTSVGVFPSCFIAAHKY